jgi:hypothetical protein
MAVRVDAQDSYEGERDPALDVRLGNDRVADKAERLRFVSRVPMLCECGSPTCRELVMVSLEEFRQLRLNPDNALTAPGHDLKQ